MPPVVEDQTTLLFDTTSTNFTSRLFVRRLQLNMFGGFLAGVFAVAFFHVIAIVGYVIWDILSPPDPLSSSRLIAFVNYQFGTLPVFFMFWVALPIVLAFYPWSVQASDSIYEKLRQQQILILNSSQTAALRADLKQVVGGISTKSALLIALILELLLFSQGLTGRWALTPEIGVDIGLFYVLGIPGFVFAACIISDIAKRYIDSVRGLTLIFKNNQATVNMRPWHPDGVGGLNVLGSYTVIVGWFIAALGFLILLATYTSVAVRMADDTSHVVTFTSVLSELLLLFWILLYAALSPTVFFATLGSAHAAMRESKQRALHQLSEGLSLEYSRVREKLDRGEALNESADNMKHLEELYRLTQRFPVWPFDFDTMRRFTTAISTPVFTFALPWAIGRLL